MKSIVKIIKLLAIIKITILIAACTDHRLDGMVDDQVYLLNYDIQNIDVFNFGEYTSDVVICKGGIGGATADVELALDQELIIRYNNMNGTSYKMLPENCYNLSATNFHFDKEDNRKVMTITYHTQAMGALSDRNNYVIPIFMKAGEGTKFDEDKQVLLVHPTYIEPIIFFPKSDASMNIPILADGDTTFSSIEISINYRNLIDPFAWDISFDIDTDMSLLEAYNASQSAVHYDLLPAAAYSLNNAHWNIAKTKTIKDVPVHLLKKKLMNGSGEYLFGNYALPIKISRVAKWSIDEDRSRLLMLVPFFPSAFDASTWKVLDWNSDRSMDEGQEDSPKTPNGMLIGTGWQSKWATPLPPMPYYFVVDMLTPKTITQINLHFLPTSSTRNLKTGTFQVSSDNVNWTSIANWVRTSASSTSDNVFQTPITSENQIKARYLKFVINEPFNYFQSGAGAQMEIQQLEVVGYE